MNKFRNLENVKVTKGKNNYFRYSSGNYEGYNKAKSALVEIHKIGYPNAFIKAVKDLSK